MKVKVTNTRCNVVEWPVGNKTKLIKAFTKKAKDAHFAKRYNKFAGDTKFISQKLGAFPTGLLHEVAKWCHENNEPLEIEDTRTVIKPKRKTAHKTLGIQTETGEPYTLRSYQREAVQEALDCHRGLIKVATAGGKTLIAASLIQCIDRPVLYIVERVNLANQTKKKFVKEYGFKSKDVGVVGGGKNEQGRLVTITTVQSAHKLDDLDFYEVVICDESHHSKAKTYVKLLKNLKNAYYRFGLSGTVFSGDELEDTYRISQFGPVLYEIGTDTLVKAGVLSRPVIRFIEINKPHVTGNKQYLDIYKEGICHNFDRNGYIIRLANELPGKTLILFKLIEHGQVLKQYIPKAIYVDGEDDMWLREKKFEGFSKHTESVMIASTILDEGIDFSNIHNLIIAGGEKSIIKNIQRLGRGLRKNDMMTVNVIEFFDRTHNTLERHSRKRMRDYQAEGHEIKLFTTEG